jgi:uncharacterized protein YjbI with pentapeptide repeats
MTLAESPLATILFAAYIAALWTLLLLVVWWGVSALLKHPPQFGNLGLHSLVMAFLLGELAGILTPASRWADNPDAPIHNSIMLASWLGAFLGALWVLTNCASQLRKLGWIRFGRLLFSYLLHAPISDAPPFRTHPRLDFSQQTLQNRSFRHQNLNGANFEGANLDGADFTEAKLIGANFRGVIAPCANFTGTHLAGANFEGAQLNHAIFDRIRGFSSIWNDSPIQRLGLQCDRLHHWLTLAEPWGWLLFSYGFVSLGALAVMGQAAQITSLMAICALLLWGLIVLGISILTWTVSGSNVAILFLMINASYLLGNHPTKTSLPIRVEITAVVVAGAIALLGIAQKRWNLFFGGLGILCGSSAVAVIPYIFPDQLPFPLIYSGIFTMWGMAIGHILGRYFLWGTCSFQHTQLDGATFIRADIRFARFHHSDLTKTEFNHAKTQGTPADSFRPN